MGHVHCFCERQGGLREPRPTITCLGTPYTTNFGEAFKDNFYAIFEDEDYTLHTPDHGPRHLVYTAEDIEYHLEDINDQNYFTFLRVMVGADHHPIPYDKIKAAHVDVKYSPVFNEEEISTYTPERDLFSINDMIISDYVEEANSIIPIETLMEGYRLLQDEN